MKKTTIYAGLTAVAVFFAAFFIFRKRANAAKHGKFGEFENGGTVKPLEGDVSFSSPGKDEFSEVKIFRAQPLVNNEVDAYPGGWAESGE